MLRLWLFCGKALGISEFIFYGEPIAFYAEVLRG